MMRSDFKIEHKDIAELGYYFIDREQEEKFLGNLNDELALRVGTEAVKYLSEDKLRDLLSIKREDFTDYLMDNIPNIEEMVIRIRKNYLLEIKNKRKTILLENGKH